MRRADSARARAGARRSIGKVRVRRAEPSRRSRGAERRRPTAPRPLIGAAIVSVLAAILGHAVQAEERFDDPFAYCAAIGTIDAPDARYAGPPMPEGIARGLRAALGASEDAPLRESSIWRCMAGKVYACTVGANLPCQEKADTSRSPTPGMTTFCRENPGSDVIPMVVTGRATVYAWRCEQGAPAIARQIAEPDVRGYLANVWYPIPRPEE